MCCEQVLVDVGEPAVGLGGGERLAVGADRRGEVGRIDHRQRLARLDLLARATSSRDTGPENGASTLVA